MAVVCLPAGGLLALLALLMPWISVDMGLLGELGVMEAEAVPGIRIPLLVREAGERPLIQAGRAAQEVFAGRLDLAAARILFGARYEERWAPLVWLPTGWCLGALLLLRLRRPRRIAPLVALLSTGLFIGGSAVLLDLTGALSRAAGGDLALHAGIPATLLALLLTAAGAAARRR